MKSEMEGSTPRSSKKKKRNPQMNIHSVLNNFASSATMHGVPRIINASSGTARLFWSAVCIGAFLTFVWTGANLLTQYYSYPKKVNVEIVQRPVPFPSVTVCNTDHLDLQVVDRLGKGFSDANDSGEDDDGEEEGEFEIRYQEYSVMTTQLIQGNQQANQQEGVSSGSLQDSLEVLSRLGIVANVGPELSSDAGINVEDFIVNCRFMDEDCNVTETFVKVFDPYYFNCFTFEPHRILESNSTRLSGVEYGLSLLLFVGCAGHIEKADSGAGGGDHTLAIPGMTESNPALVTGQGARVVVHSPNTMPLPTADGFDVPSGYSISIGLRARENIRIGPPHGNCTQTDDGGGDGRPHRDRRYAYTLVSCQNECIQRAIMKTCRCVDNRIPALHSEASAGGESSLPFCLELTPISDACAAMPPGNDYASESNFPDSSGCDELKSRNAAAFRRRLECRKQVYENMTIRDPDAMDRCGCHPPCRDVAYETSNSLSMLPDNQRGHAFYMIVDNYVDKMASARKKILRRRYGSKYAEDVKKLTVRVNVHIADSNIIKTTESPDYDLIRLVSDIGGQLGLWIGISVITLIEVLQLCADVFRIIVYHGRRLRGDWKQELPKSGKNHNQQQQQRSPSKLAKDGDMAGDGGGGGGPAYQHHHYHHPVVRQQQSHRPLTAADGQDDEDAAFEIDKMTSV